MKHLYFSLLFLLLIGTVFGQGNPTEYKWCFGYSAGVNFSSGNPVAFLSAINSNEGSASISNAAGNLLLQADGERASGANNVVLPNGNGLLGSTIAAQSNLFIQDPGNPQRYYLFTVNNWTDPSTDLRYSVIDMTLNGGNGDIISGMKNIVVSNDAREQLTATRHSNGVDWWVLSHRFNNAEFTAYLLTATGINPTPVVSAVGMIYSGANRYGSLRFSYGCQKKLVSVLGGSSANSQRVQLFDFDTSTGTVSNPVTLATSANIPDAYSAEFSPDDSKLYVTSYNTAVISQFNLNSANIAGSLVPIGNTTSGTKSWVQLGPDNKIYVARPGTNFLGVINQPNLLGAAANYQNNGVNLGVGWCGLALPNFPNTTASNSSLIIANAGPPVSLCSGATAALQPQNQQPGYTYSWSPATGLSDPLAFNPTVTLTNTTSQPYTVTYTLTATINGCSNTDAVTVTVNPGPVANAGAPLSLCSGATTALQPQGQQAGVTYSWSPATGLSDPLVFNPSVTLTNTTTVPYTVTYTLTATSNGCSSSDVVAVTVNPGPAVNAGPSISMCDGATAVLQPQGQQPGYTYAWSPATGLSDPTVFAPTVSLSNSSGLPYLLTYTLTATINGCSNSDMVTVTVNPSPTVNAGSPLSVCSGAIAALQPQGQQPGYTYAWSPATGLSDSMVFAPSVTLINNTGSPYTVTYTLTAISSGCSKTDTASVTVNPKPTGVLTGSVLVCPQVQQAGYLFAGSAGATAAGWGVSGGTIHQQFGTDSITVNWDGTNPAAYVWVVPLSNMGCLGDTLKLPVVIGTQVNSPAPSGPTSVCADSTVTHIYNTSNTAGATYTWNISGGQIISGNGTSQVQVSWQQPGTGQLWVLQQSLTLTDTCLRASDTLFVQVLPAPDPVLAVTGNAGICAGTSATYSVAGNSTSTYTWQVQGGQIISGQGTQTIEVQWNTPGNHSLTVQATGSNGCPGRPFSLPVEVFGVPVTSMLSAPPGICPGSTAGLTYSVQGPAGSHYQWQVTGGQIMSGQGTSQVSITWDPAAAATGLSVTETSANGCAGALLTFPVLVDNSHLQLLSVTVDTTNESQVQVHYWVADSVNYPQTHIEVQRQQSPGSYVAAGNSAVASAVFTDTGLNTGQQAFYYRLQGQNLCADQLLSPEHATVWLQAQVQPGNQTALLQWTPYVGWGSQDIEYQVWLKLASEPDYQLLTWVTSQTSAEIPLLAGGLSPCFRITAIAADSRQSWSNSACLVVEYPLVVPNIITPNGDGKNDEFSIDHLHLYPNSELLILNRWGKEVYRNPDYRNNWGAKGLPGGVYFYQLTVPGQPAMKGWVEVQK